MYDSVQNGAEMGKTVLVIFCMAFLIGCGNSSVLVNPSYHGKDLSNKTLLIMPIADYIVNVQNKDDVSDDFEEDKREPELIVKELVAKVINNNAQKFLSGINLLKADFDTNMFLSQRDTSVYFSVYKKIGEDSTLYRFFVPRNEALKSKGVSPDIVVVINKLSFGRNITSGGSYYVPGHTVTTPGGTFTTPGHFATNASTEFLGANLEFIIYDYLENDVIVYGKTSVKTDVFFAMTKSTWTSTFDKIASELFNRKPFKWTGRRY